MLCGWLLETKRNLCRLSVAPIVVAHRASNVVGLVCCSVGFCLNTLSLLVYYSRYGNDSVVCQSADFREQLV